MKTVYADESDIHEWMRLVSGVRYNFPGLETEEGLDDYRNTVLKFMSKKQAICVKADGEIKAVMLFSRGRNMICCLAVSPDFRRLGTASLLMNEALRSLDRTREITVSTFRAEDEKGLAPRALYEKYGFVSEALVEEMGYPNQRYVLYPDTSPKREKQLAINKMVHEIEKILLPNNPSVYLYGSSVMDDFKLGWSDIDILVLTETPISDIQAEKLVFLRQSMMKKEPDNPYYRLFEGGILAFDAFTTKKPDRVVYWGTSGERITDRYHFDSFCMAQLKNKSMLLYGKDVRGALEYPEYEEMLADIGLHLETIRKYAGSTGRSLYSFGWMLDIARCIYTLRTGEIISKTEAGEWALSNHLCPDPDAMAYALKVRKNPADYAENESVMDYAQTLFAPIQRFADVLEVMLKTDQ